MRAYEFGKLMQKFCKEYKMQIEAQLSPSLTEGQLNVLEILHTENMMKPSDLIEFLDTTAAAVTTLLDRMEKNKLIKRERDHQDRRIVWIHVSAHGKAEWERGVQIRNQILSQFLNRISIHNQQLFIYLLGKVSSLHEPLDQAK